jgi:prepilin-type N-terminal cleavage/methylation domain-containing protein
MLKTKVSINNKPLEKGFTMIELMIVMIIITILSSAFVPHLFNYEEKRADLVSAEMWAIAEAVQSYDTQEGEFPDRANGCVDAIDILSAATATFLQGIDRNKTAWGGNTRYLVSCSASSTSATTLTISLGRVHPDWAKYIANQLPQANVTFASPTGRASTITLPVGKLAYTPVLNRFLYRSASPTASTATFSNGDKVEYFDAQNNIIKNVVDIELSGRKRPEEKINYLSFNQGLKSAWSLPKSTVNKPNCDFDGDTIQDASPTINVIPSSIAAANGEEIMSWTSRVSTPVASPTLWEVWIELTTPSGGTKTVSPTSKSTLFFSTRCVDPSWLIP